MALTRPRLFDSRHGIHAGPLRQTQEPAADRQQPQGAMDPTPPFAACLSRTAALLSLLACEGTGSLGPPLVRVVDDESRWLSRHPSPFMEVCGAAPVPSVGHGRCFCGHLTLLAGCLAIRHMPSPVDYSKPKSERRTQSDACTDVPLAAFRSARFLCCSTHPSQSIVTAC